MAAIDRDGVRALASHARLHSFEEGPGVHSEPSADYGADVACVVDTGAARYPVYCGWDLLDRLSTMLDTVGASGRIFLVTDASVGARYADPVIAALRTAGRQVASHAIPQGETSKNLARLEQLYAWLASERAERGDTVLALGGGVVTDLAGTAAATYLRGMALVQVPTSLLAMVDAAIGGKVAVDLPAGKNLVGAFYQPLAVVADVATLATLPDRELRAGYAEVIKHAFIRDAAMLDALERDADLLLALGQDATTRDRAVALVGRNMAIKATVVSADERESDLRAILNYGHTIGHAIEAAQAYGGMLHGEAISVGMVGAAMIAERVGLIDSAIVERHKRVFTRFGSPIRLVGKYRVSTDAILGAIQSDKKVSGGEVSWVLLESVGNPVLRKDVPSDVVRDVVNELTGG